MADGSAFGVSIFVGEVRDIPGFTCGFGRCAGGPFSRWEAPVGVLAEPGAEELWKRRTVSAAGAVSCTGSRHFPSPSSELRLTFKELPLTLLFFFSSPPLFFLLLEQIKEHSPASLSWHGGTGSASSNGVAAQSKVGRNA